MTLITVPAIFFDDHRERGLPTPAEVRRAGNVVLVDRDDPALPELLSDARYYADVHGPDEAPRSITASAKRTVAALRGFCEPKATRLPKLPSDTDYDAVIGNLRDQRSELVRILGKILRAHDSGNNGAYMGEASLCRAFEVEAVEALIRSRAESELIGGSAAARAALKEAAS